MTATRTAAARPAFKKGDAVTFIQDWNRKGAATYRHAVVYSCGKKQMVLTDAATGEEMGRHFAPKLGDDFGGTFPRMTDAEAAAAALKVGERVIAREKAHFEHCLTRDASEGYLAAIRKDLAEIEAATPQGIEYADAIAVIRAAIARK